MSPRRAAFCYALLGISLLCLAVSIGLIITGR